MAQPFQPIEFAIFNEGVPSSVFYGAHPEHDIVSHIADEAIDETFPPSAEDVAEMEAAEEFVEFMAWLAFLDEHEEQARASFAGFKKRWESRRTAGLVGKPKSVRPEVAPYLQTAGASVKETDLVPYVPRVYEGTNFKAKNKMMQRLQHQAVPKNVKGLHGYAPPIQQPRKHN